MLMQIYFILFFYAINKPTVGLLIERNNSNMSYKADFKKQRLSSLRMALKSLMSSRSRVAR